MSLTNCSEGRGGISTVGAPRLTRRRVTLLGEENRVTRGVLRRLELQRLERRTGARVLLQQRRALVLLSPVRLTTSGHMNPRAHRIRASIELGLHERLVCVAVRAKCLDGLLEGGLLVNERGAGFGGEGPVEAFG